MITKITPTLFSLLIATVILPYISYGQTPTEDQLRLLLPTAKELQGFVRFNDSTTIGELVSTVPKGEAEFSIPGHPPVQVIKDRIFMNREQPTLEGAIENFSLLERSFYTANANLHLAMSVRACTSTKSSWAAFLALHGSAPQTPGKHASSDEIGTKSTTLNGDSPTLNFYHQKIAVHLNGSQSNVAERAHSTIKFPAQSLDSIAFLIFLKAARHPELTGVTSRPVKVLVNGEAITAGNPIVVGKTVYVPAIDIAKKAGFVATWDEPTGKLFITSETRAVNLLAGFDKAITANGKITKMKMPVLKEGGLPVMSLTDLVDVLGGKLEFDETTYYVRF